MPVNAAPCFFAIAASPPRCPTPAWLTGRRPSDKPAQGDALGLGTSPEGAVHSHADAARTVNGRTDCPAPSTVQSHTYRSSIPMPCLRHNARNSS
jgi:hypothetical protein